MLTNIPPILLTDYYTVLQCVSKIAHTHLSAAYTNCKRL